MPQTKLNRKLSNEKLRREDPDHFRRQQLKAKFGITLERYNEILRQQNDSCAICDRHKDQFQRSLHVDHCHHTGEVRGLLCPSCNSGIGKLQDSIPILKSAVAYLEKYN